MLAGHGSTCLNLHARCGAPGNGHFLRALYRRDQTGGNHHDRRSGGAGAPRLLLATGLVHELPDVSGCASGGPRRRPLPSTTAGRSPTSGSIDVLRPTRSRCIRRCCSADGSFSPTSASRSLHAQHGRLPTSHPIPRAATASGRIKAVADGAGAERSARTALLTPLARPRARPSIGWRLA